MTLSFNLSLSLSMRKRLSDSDSDYMCIALGQFLYFVGQMFSHMNLKFCFYLKLLAAVTIAAVTAVPPPLLTSAAAARLKRLDNSTWYTRQHYVEL